MMKLSETNVHPLWLRNGGICIVAAFLLFIGIDAAMAQVQRSADAGVWHAILKWTPLMFWGTGDGIGGFVLNVLVSVLAMAIGTAMGVVLGIGQVSRNRLLQRTCWWVTQILQNSPWLVLLFYFMLLLPYQVEIGGTRVPVPGWLKATLGLSLPIMANIAEITRGAISSIPTVQWEAAESLAFTRRQTMWRIILPQCVKRMIPPWMNWYCILMMSTPLISILGVQDAMTLTQDALAAEQRQDLLIPFYLWLMTWFFVYTYPISRWTRRLERRFAVKT